MKKNPLLLWFDDTQATDATLVGPKAARLAIMHQAGLPVPPAFMLTIHAFATGMSEEVEHALRTAYRTLASTCPDLLEGQRVCGQRVCGQPVAVRSSATAEDLAGASFAGMQETVLNVRGEGEMLAAVRRVWASVESAEAQAYRKQIGVEGGGMAVVVQLQVEATVAGVAFGNDPIRGGEVYIIEAVAGLGEQLVSGEVDPQRWRIAPADEQTPEHSHHYLKLDTPDEPLLSEGELTEVITLLERATERFGTPQDVEWAADGERVWMLQARPITTREENWFTDELPADHHLWCAAFLNERFTQPVSPLGWSMIAKPLERLALRGPLELLGAGDMNGPLLKLWRGHPYSRVEAWQRIYKLFFDWMLPDDAVRYFPAGDVSLRHAPRQPTYGLHLVWNGLRLLWQNLHAASPFHNPQAWARYEKRQAAAMIRFRFAERQLKQHADPIPAARALLQEVADLTDELLELHRWSLLYTDLSYSLLRRFLMMRYGATEGALRAVKLTTHVESPTTEMNRILGHLAAKVAQNKEIYEWLKEIAAGSLSIDDAQSAPNSSTRQAFSVDLRQFLKEYGHRFFSLDFYDAPWEADIPAFARFLLTLSQASGRARISRNEETARHDRARISRNEELEEKTAKVTPTSQYPKGTLSPLPNRARISRNKGEKTAKVTPTSQYPKGTLSSIRNSQSAIRNPQSPIPTSQSAIRNPQSAIRNFIQSYMRLREAQRFYWQELLALQRRVVLVMGNWWAERGQLAAAEHVFGLTWDELMTGKPNRERAAARMKALHRLRTQARQAPAWHYPDFLRGTTPLMTGSSVAQGSQLKARPVSPGIARGPARLIAHPGDFERLRPGDILVTASPDPGWTPIFGTLAGLVTERGGQLSHGAVIAREYGLPAVSGIAGLLGILREGEMLLVDGTEGIVVRLEQGIEHGLGESKGSEHGLGESKGSEHGLGESKGSEHGLGESKGSEHGLGESKG